MARAYSLDLRERVVAAVDNGRSCRSVADVFGLSISCVVKWSQRFRTTGTAAPGQIGGHRPVLLADHRDFILARLAAKPDETLRGLRAELLERGVMVSYGTLWNFVHRQGLSFKKKRSAVRAGSTGRRPTPRAVEKVSGPD
jgi:transposase